MTASYNLSLLGSNYNQGGTGAVARTTASKLQESVSVKDFGAVGDGVTDDTSALNAFFSYIAANNVTSAQCCGIFLVSGKITFSGSSASTKRVDFAATFNSNFASENEIFLVQGIYALQFNGKLTINGNGNTNYSSRSNGRGIVFNNCDRLEVDYIEISYAKYDAVRVIGTSSQVKINYLKAWYCGGSSGTGATSTSFAFSAAANSGSSGSTYQVTNLTVSPGSVGYLTANESIIKIGSTMHFVNAVNNTTGVVTIFPWIENGVTSGSASAYVGAGYFGEGSDNSAVSIGVLDTLVCGIGCYNRALYPASITSHVTQYCGVGHVIGLSPSSGSVAGFTGYSYYEANDFDIVQLTNYKIGYVFGATTALTTSKAIKIAPRLTDGTFNPKYTAFDGVSIGINGLLYQRRLGAISGDSESPLNAQLSPTSTPIYSQRSNGCTINLLSDAQNQRAFAINDIIIVVRGTGSNGQPTGTLTLVPEAGYSINGNTVGASVNLQNFSGVVVLYAWLNGTNWEVNSQKEIKQLLGNANKISALKGAAGTFTTITLSFAGNNGDGDVIANVWMTGYSGVFLDICVGRYSSQPTVEMRKTASAGTTVAYSGAGGTLTMTITTSVVNPVVSADCVIGGYSTDFSTNPTITFA